MALKEWDRVRTVNGRQGVVKAVDGQWIEVVFDGRGGEAEQVHIDDVLKESEGPIDDLLTGTFGNAEAAALRLGALFLKHAYKFDPRSGLSNARIEPNLHQIYVAHVVTRKLQPRMILADEVGLGKTIEAGLILKELRARGLVDRVLVVVPASLQYQWQQELRSKFNEDFEVMTSAAAKYHSQGGRNPFDRVENVICSLPFASHPKRAEQIVESDWDLVIFDEAHRVRRWRQGRTRVQTTRAYRLGDDLKELTPGLLLLTATPMQLHPFELYSLIELVEPGMYPTFGAYERRRSELPRLNDLMRILKSWSVLDEVKREAALSQHNDLLADLIGVSDHRRLEDPDVRTDVMDRLVERHPLAGALVRNRKAEVGGFTTREAERIVVPMSESEKELYEDITEYIRLGYDRALLNKQQAVGFLMVGYQKMLASSTFCVRESFKRRIAKLKKTLAGGATTRRKAPSGVMLEILRDAPELGDALAEVESAEEPIDRKALAAEIAELELLVDRLGDIEDSKAEQLLSALDDLFAQSPDEKVVIFTQFKDTQEYLRRQIERDYRVACFNGSMNIDDKEAAIKLFRDSAQVLISTEAGGEGRNLQFAHILVNYDLPWNPMKVEQRIGRLDRIGQRRPVFIYNLACKGTIEQRVLDVLQYRIQLFTESVGSLDPILGDVEQEIERLVMLNAAKFAEAFDELEEDLEAKTREARENERVLADFVLDRASLRRDRANELLGQSALATHKDLEHFIDGALAFYGGTLKPHSEGGVALSFSPKLSTRLRAKAPSIRGAFDARDALAMEDLDFFAMGHPIIDEILDLPLKDEPATTAIRFSHEPDLSGLAVEIVYELKSEEPAPLGRVVRHVVGGDGGVRVEEIHGLPEIGTSAPPIEVPSWAAAAVAASRGVFTSQLEATRAELHEQIEQRRDERRSRAHRIFVYRQERLQHRIGEDLAWIEEKELRGSERDRRILPARRGKLAKDRERLERLEADFNAELQTIESERPALTGNVWYAGLVVPA